MLNTPHLATFMKPSVKTEKLTGARVCDWITAGDRRPVSQSDAEIHIHADTNGNRQRALEDECGANAELESHPWTISS